MGPMYIQTPYIITVLSAGVIEYDGCTSAAQ